MARSSKPGLWKREGQAAEKRKANAETRRKVQATEKDRREAAAKAQAAEKAEAQAKAAVDTARVTADEAKTKLAVPVRAVAPRSCSEAGA